MASIRFAKVTGWLMRCGNMEGSEETTTEMASKQRVGKRSFKEMNVLKRVCAKNLRLLYEKNCVFDSKRETRLLLIVIVRRSGGLVGLGLIDLSGDLTHHMANLCHVRGNLAEHGR